MNKIKFAVTGCGHIGKRHAEMILRNNDCELVALIDTDSTVRANFASVYSHIPSFESLDSFLQSATKADVMVIATPNGFHTTQACSAIENGMHVVIEKPMSLKRTDSESVIALAQQYHKEVFCVMQNRYSPPSQWLKSIVTDGILGQIYLVQINCYWNRDERYYKKESWHGTRDLDGGTLFTQFSHFVDLMYWVFGDIKNIHSKFASFNHASLTDFEDSGLINFEFENGGIGNFNYTTSVWDKNLESSMTIIAEHGTLKVGGQYMDKVDYCHVKNYTMPILEPTNPPNDYGPYKGSAANHHFIIENVVDTLHHDGIITTNALEGMKVVDIIERMYAGAK